MKNSMSQKSKNVISMPVRRKYNFLEHTADVYIVAYGHNLYEALENAALATFEVITDVDRVEHKFEDSVEVEAHDEYALLYNWLEELIVRFEITGNLYSRFEISKIERIPDGFRLRGRVWGEPFVPEKHTQKVGVKGVTYHRMQIEKKPESVTIKFILDI